MQSAEHPTSKVTFRLDYAISKFKLYPVAPLRIATVDVIATVNNMADKTEDSTPLLAEEGGIRQRNKAPKEETQFEPSPESGWNPDLPYGGKVYLARKKKPDPWWVTALEVSASCGNVESDLLTVHVASVVLSFSHSSTALPFTHLTYR